MSDLKRYEIKYVRDISKSAYKKESKCKICSSVNNLEFHHYYSMSLLWSEWKRKLGIKITNVEDILHNRILFKEAHHIKIYEETITLCKKHHQLLHKIYGKVPKLITAEKQKRWIRKQEKQHA